MEYGKDRWNRTQDLRIPAHLDDSLSGRPHQKAQEGFGIALKQRIQLTGTGQDNMVVWDSWDDFVHTQLVPSFLHGILAVGTISVIAGAVMEINCPIAVRAVFEIAAERLRLTDGNHTGSFLLFLCKAVICKDPGKIFPEDFTEGILFQTGEIGRAHV